MKVLLVGGAGYVGGAVTDLLLQSQHHIRVYDALFYEEAYRKPVDFVYGDVRDRESLKPHLDWAEVVIWLAALVGDAACALNPDVSIDINQETVKWLAQNFKGRIFFLSTCSVYGARDGVLDETAPTNPLSVYAVTKLEAEHHLAGSNALIFRLGTLFGVGDLFSRIRLDLVVNTLSVKAHQTGKLQVYGGDQFRPLLHVRDAAQTIVDNIVTEHTGIFNLHNQNIRIIDLAYQVRGHFPDLIIEQQERKFEDTRNYRASSDKAKTILEFNPVRSIDEGIEEIKALLDYGRLKNVDNPRYTNQKFLSISNSHIREK
ncbi:MAG: NAD(P)-dependent oxidoreductase [Dehalococcoidales bacterium]|jgi:nucleoside-diphosphate-sugar epimerase|nr:NAD(P)-dependent oxidoreductase [Dehalococcoidales bacterium]MDP7110174.1 NAD(P)-dependent oxidoreductase [Dehalococcoidales bacterium]MDP7309682.1 NAD(P)-dependent oxidoreductase [Dehalococcoidales bacterium]MDP7409385.1 NAD(P)-dependent oxidoreductase [Dehalococcoidales bacterium]MDP7675720.1 NAD(P)-dependent oxidoreductase [Dehalococcoidales bacterium]|tara:strand:- start:1011 stop:1958 length:948 start_codon:yes stop_codon:yes gene_type:complete